MEAKQKNVQILFLFFLIFCIGCSQIDRTTNLELNPNIDFSSNRIKNILKNYISKKDKRSYVYFYYIPSQYEGDTSYVSISQSLTIPKYIFKLKLDEEYVYVCSPFTDILKDKSQIDSTLLSSLYCPPSLKFLVIDTNYIQIEDYNHIQKFSRIRFLPPEIKQKK